MRWDIEPFVGLGPLKFGMSRDAVGAVMAEFSPVRAVDPVYDGSLNEYRSLSEPVCNYVDGKLSAIDTDRRVKDVFFKGLNLYEADPLDVLRVLQHENGGAKCALGSTLFENIGVNTGGFFMEKEGRVYKLGSPFDDDERGICVFMKGAFDALLPNFKPVQF